MNSFKQKALTYFTLASCLVVGSSAVRMYLANDKKISINTSYINVLSGLKLPKQEIQLPKTIVRNFREIEFPSMQMTYVEEIPKVINITFKKKATTPAPVKVQNYKESVLPFFEPIALSPIYFEGSLPKNLVALYEPIKDFEEVKTMLAEAAPKVEDIVSTVSAAPTTNAEPEFFEYTQDELRPVVATTENKKEEKVIKGKDAVEEVAIDDLVAFDYSKANQDIVQNKLPTMSKVTHSIVSSTVPVSMPNQAKKIAPEVKKEDPKAKQAEEKSLLRAPAKKVSMVIQAVGTDLKYTKPVTGFEIRFQDDLSEILEDHNSGSALFEEKLSESSMTRSVTILKRGYAPTNTELIVESGSTDISLPLIEEHKFNEYMESSLKKGAAGAILVELDDETEYAKIDAPSAEPINMDGDLKITKTNDFRYQFFTGVRAGNVLITYKDNKGNLLSKIIHVHENELTYDANIYESVKDEKLVLNEEDLLAKEKEPLIIAADQVKEFASNKESVKINDHTYKVGMNRQLLASRRYFELTHQNEPIFIGTRSNNNVSVPSENFMRYVLSKLEGQKLGNRCLVQVNLSKKAQRVDVGSESSANSIVTFTQVLDKNGKFYDSVGEKTQKIIVVGENQGAPELNQDGKINLKITYQDGSVQYMGSYCSPNTYLVEQL